MNFTEKIAMKIVNMISDGRISIPMIQTIGYWIAQYSAGSEAEYKMLALSEAITQSMEEVKDQDDRIQWS